MIRKTLGILVLVGLGAIVAAQWQDIARYIKISRLSSGSGHPELVPAEGRTSYPKEAAGGAAEGEGEFDAPSRGGPAREDGEHVTVLDRARQAVAGLAGRANGS